MISSLNAAVESAKKDNPNSVDKRHLNARKRTINILSDRLQLNPKRIQRVFDNRHRYLTSINVDGGDAGENTGASEGGNARTSTGANARMSASTSAAMSASRSAAGNASTSAAVSVGVEMGAGSDRGLNEEENEGL